MNWLRASWDAVRTSLWLIPALMLLLGAALAIAALQLSLSGPLRDWTPWIGSGNGEDARNLISTLLTSVIAMASIVFSITIIALTLAANTYGPRLIRTFRSDRRTHVVLGIFVMTIVYLLLVLRGLNGEAQQGEVPEAAVALGAALALFSVLALLAFVQGVASLITADQVVGRVRHELDSAISNLPPEEHHASTHSLPEGFNEAAARIALPREGYVQSVEFSGIVRWAEKNDVTVKLDFRPGEFVVDGDHKVAILPPPADLQKARREIDRFIVSGQARTPTQDLEFAIRYLVEIAVRALSPGINDPFTALAAVDRLRGGLAKLCARQLPSPTLCDASGAPRLFRDVASFAGMVNAAFNQIRQAGSRMPAVLIHMLESIEALADHARSAEHREALGRHASLIRAAAHRDVADPDDRRDVDRAADRAQLALRAAQADELRAPCA